MAKELTPKQKKDHEKYLIISLCKNPVKVLVENGHCKSEHEARKLVDEWNGKK
jgi:hypothetical protein